MMPWRTTLCLASAAVWVTAFPCSDFFRVSFQKPPWKSQQWWNTSGAMEEWQPNDLRWRKMNRFGCLMFECKAHPVDDSEIRLTSWYPVDTENISQCLQGFIHPRLCRISSINSRRTLPILSSIHHIVHPDGISTLVFTKGHHILVEKWKPMQMNLMFQVKDVGDILIKTSRSKVWPDSSA